MATTLSLQHCVRTTPVKCSMHTFHVQFPAYEVLDIPHKRPDFGAVVRVVSQLAPNELLLCGALIQHHEIHRLSRLRLDGCAHLQTPHVWDV